MCASGWCGFHKDGLVKRRSSSELMPYLTTSGRLLGDAVPAHPVDEVIFDAAARYRTRRDAQFATDAQRLMDELRSTTRFRLQLDGDLVR
jgi:hypothetical protein